MKACKRCKATKPLSEFYKTRLGSAKHYSRCKECTKAVVRAYREAGGERYKEYCRKKQKEPKHVEARREYMRARPELHKRINAKWVAANPEKVKARRAVEHAIKKGKLEKLPCSVCGSFYRTHGHHEDYSKPLDVNWLCATHHAARHRELRMMRLQDGGAK
jgi:hypothetical protein